MKSSREFLEFVINDLKHIRADLKGFLDVYYPMLWTSCHPENELDFILGWIIGSKEQEYSNVYYERNRERMYPELLFEIQREIVKHKEEMQNIIIEYLNQKEPTSNTF